MPVHMDTSPLHRLVVIVARGHIAAEEIAATTRQLVEANVPAYAKIIDVSQATSELTREQVQKVADLLRGAPDDTSRGPVAFVINPDRIGFANVFADVTQGERPIQLFRSLHEARAWLERARQGLPECQAAERRQATSRAFSLRYSSSEIDFADFRRSSFESSSAMLKPTTWLL